MNVVGYTRVSTAEQDENGYGLEAQWADIQRYATNNLHTLVNVHRETASGSKLATRPKLLQALEACRAGEADAIVVAKLDRLTRSVIDLGLLLERAKTERWNIIALDFGLDISTPQGELVANVLASVAQWERRMISQRTREGLAQARAEGVRLGAPRKVPPQAERVAHALRAQGWPLRHIRDSLDARGYGSYSLDTISRVLRRDPAVAA